MAKKVSDSEQRMASRAAAKATADIKTAQRSGDRQALDRAAQAQHEANQVISTWMAQQ
jgi:hypothetical protein